MVAAKLQSRLSRRGPSKDKELSDVYDIYRLLAAHDRRGAVGEELVTAPVDISDFCIQQLGAIFFDEADRWTRRINVAFQATAVRPEDFEVVGTLAIDGIRQALAIDGSSKPTRPRPAE